MGSGGDTQELEEKGSVYLDESKIITVDEALAIAEKEGAVIRWVNARTLFEQIVKGHGTQVIQAFCS